MEIPTGFVAKARFVRVIFTDVQREYDVLLGLLTFGMDWVWRRRLLSRITRRKPLRVVDLACGSGLITFPLQRLVGMDGLVVGLDPSVSICNRPSEGSMPVGFRSSSCGQSGEFMPFRDSVFDYETVGLALRNFGDKCSLICKLYLFYVLKVFPVLGKLVSNSWHRHSSTWESPSNSQVLPLRSVKCCQTVPSS